MVAWTAIERSDSLSYIRGHAISRCCDDHNDARHEGSGQTRGQLADLQAWIASFVAKSGTDDEGIRGLLRWYLPESAVESI
jgi:hypothetical protein